MTPLMVMTPLCLEGPRHDDWNGVRRKRPNPMIADGANEDLGDDPFEI
jgi:hypothetical protein